MTYRDILIALRGVPSEQLDQDATVRHGGDEFTGVIEIGISYKGDPADGILDHGHLYFDIHGGGI